MCFRRLQTAINGKFDKDILYRPTFGNSEWQACFPPTTARGGGNILGTDMNTRAALWSRFKIHLKVSIHMLLCLSDIHKDRLFSPFRYEASHLIKTALFGVEMGSLHVQNIKI